MPFVVRAVKAGALSPISGIGFVQLSENSYIVAPIFNDKCTIGCHLAHQERFHMQKKLYS